MAKGAAVLTELLAEAGVRQVFGIPSGPWCPFMEAMRTGEVEFVLVSNEASAGFMADVCGRITGKPGACYGTTGPGATNLSTGVGSAYLDRSPQLAFTSEARDAMRHRTMQMWIDHQALFRPLTKWTTTLRPHNFHDTFAHAVQVALSEVPGPVHLGLPEDLGYDDVPPGSLTMPELLRPPLPEPQQLADVQRLLQQARKPLLAVGLSVMRSAAPGSRCVDSSTPSSCRSSSRRWPRASWMRSIRAMLECSSMGSAISSPRPTSRPTWCLRSAMIRWNSITRIGCRMRHWCRSIRAGGHRSLDLCGGC